MLCNFMAVVLPQHQSFKTTVRAVSKDHNDHKPKSTVFSLENQPTVCEVAT